MDSTQTVNTIVQSLYDKKGLNVLALDLSNLDLMIDYCIICEGNVDRHVKTLAHNAEKDLRNLGIEPLYKDGQQTCDWVIVDYGDVVLHVMTPELRERYCLEKLWKEAQIVSIELDQEAKVSNE